MLTRPGRSISGNDLDQELSGVKRRMVAKGFVITAFGAGLFLAYCFPSKFIIIALAVMLVAAGIFIIKA